MLAIVAGRVNTPPPNNPPQMVQELFRQRADILVDRLSHAHARIEAVLFNLLGSNAPSPEQSVSTQMGSAAFMPLDTSIRSIERWTTHIHSMLDQIDRVL